METRSTLLTAPPLHNCSCSHPRYAQMRLVNNLTFSDVTQAALIFLLSAGILVANLLVMIVLNSRRYSRHIHAQPRYLLTSLASNDLAIGLFVTPFGFLPALYRCWPYGELLCQIQALLRGALSQQSAVILICMAIDRYMCMLHPLSYHKRSSKKILLEFLSHELAISLRMVTVPLPVVSNTPKGCVAIISLTWITSLTLFAAMVLPRGGYYFNHTGLLACDPFFSRASFRILSCCFFYFPTTMILMYCYGSAFHVNKLRLKKVTCTAVASPDDFDGSTVEKFIAHERRLSTNASRTMAAMSLGFIVMVTPWTIQEVVAACTGSKVPPFLDFLVTWFALSNSFWNPFLYWLLNQQFRHISKEIMFTLLCCRRDRKAKNQVDRCCSSSSPGIVAPPFRHCKYDAEGLSEKHWGEILERTVSSNSLQAMQRICPPPPPPPPPPPLPFHRHKHSIGSEMRILENGLLEATHELHCHK